MEQILSKKEKEKLMDNYATEKTEDNNISIDLENKIINKDNKNKSKSKEDPDGINKLFDNLFEEIIQNTHINLVKKDDSYLISRSSTDTEKKSSCC